MLEKRYVNRYNRELYYIHILGRVAEWSTSHSYIQYAHYIYVWTFWAASKIPCIYLLSRQPIQRVSEFVHVQWLQQHGVGPARYHMVSIAPP